MTERLLTEYEFLLFEKLIFSVSGLHLTEDKNATISDAIFARMEELHQKKPSEYYDYIKNSDSSGKEIQKLINSITINETYFFRHPHHFKVLKTKILPELSLKNAFINKPIRIWCAGSATGEEVYSVAIILHEMGLTRKEQMFLVGTDIDSRAVRFAQRAIYNQRSFRIDKKRLLEHYFSPHKDGFALNPVIRGIPKFDVHNILKRESFAYNQDKFDCIFCRNVLIYFQREAIENTLSYFHSMLEPGGYLFLGGTETLNMYRHTFKDILEEKTFYYQKRNAGEEQVVSNGLLEFTENIDYSIARDSFQITDSAKSKGNDWKKGSDTLRLAAICDNDDVEDDEPEELTEPEKLSKMEELFEQAREAFQFENYHMAYAKLKDILRIFPDDIKTIVLLAETLLNLGHYEESETQCKDAIARDTMNPEPHYLLGCLEKVRKNDNKAIVYFRRSIYLDPTLVMGHFSLANLFRDQHDFKSAQRSYAAAKNILQNKIGLKKIKFLSGFHPEMIVRACEKNLENIAQLRKEKN